jgi:hypothetical protein
MKRVVKFRVALNGSATNPYLHLGLTSNPFPAIPDARFAGANEMLRQLDSEPLQSTDDIRRILKGCDQAFIDLCCSKFIPGIRVQFIVEFPE